ncbi:hypothetical protein BDZ45DRAFT_742518 [Acephala macrosclerotiorum]|nr:hypothetical protein BDZ45DRAFT_742518 [Acephala macrosclerotiorum]
MKGETEEHLDEPIKRLTVTTPSLLTHVDRSDLKVALDKASLRVSSCRDIEDSNVAAAIETRFFQFPEKRDEHMTPTECILGVFGLEEVVIVDFTNSVLSSKENFIAIKDHSISASGIGAEDEEVRTGIREVMVLRTQILD